jgi:uncharacterized protein YodC (DUF2158 family)
MEFKAAKVGTTVRLNSGGPVMTIEEILTGHRVKCVWCYLGSAPQNDEFPIACLTEVIPRTDIDKAK